MEQDNIERINLDHINWKSSEEFFNSLREELDKLDDKDESYNFTWVGKRKSIIEAGAPINKTLRPDMDASKDFDNTKNMLIVGDNLDALKLLQESYLGKIKMIYIDPPYNTGHDFVYHDNFTVKKNEYEDNTTDSEGNKIISEDEFTENSKSNGRFHSDWLSMMYPRLKLARNLLTDDGVIFISIDDNEQDNLKKICNEVFGEDDYITTFIWKKRSGGGYSNTIISTNHEYILCISKNIEKTLLYDRMKDATLAVKNYAYSDEISRYKRRDLRKSGTADRRIDRPTMFYPVIAPDGSSIFPKKANGEDGRWSCSQERYTIELSKGNIEFVKKGDEWKVYQKERFDETTNKSEKHESLLLDIALNTDGANDIEQLFGDKNYFSFSKPNKLIKYLLSIGSKGNDIILDFFAGSGTTGHAVMDLNAEDGNNRKYILVQLDEKTDDKSEARKAGYDTIDQITAERLRRAGDKIIKEHPDLEGKLDTGFRVFHIDSANEREDIRKSVYDTKQEDMFDAIDNIKHDRTPLDLLFGTIIYMALPLDLKLEVKHINDNTVYFYGYQDEGMGLIACFDDSISDDTVKEIAKLKPLTAVFKDSSFKDSSAKINLSEIFRTISNDTRVKVI